MDEISRTDILRFLPEVKTQETLQPLAHFHNVSTPRKFIWKASGIDSKVFFSGFFTDA